VAGNSRRVGPVLIRFLSGLAVVIALGQLSHGQRQILFEDFESDTPDTFPSGADFYARSLVPFVNPLTEPAKITVSGGTFPDPFGSGNQSVVFHNPNSAAQMAITWTSAFDDDPSAFRNGVIEFDVWMEKPLPNPGKFWAFLDIRLGYGDASRSGVTTVNDVTIWDNIRIQNLAGLPEPVESVVDAGAQFAVGVQTTYTDAALDLMGPDRSFRVRYEIDGTPGNEMYVIKLNGTPITWFQDGASSHPWVPGANGINVLSFLTDASAFFAGGASNVYLDNLRVINNDLPPGIDGDFNNDGAYNCADIDALSVAVANNGVVAQFDLNGDSLLSILDVDAWRAEAGAANIGVGRSYRVGDANLDGNVDGSDFGIWNSNKFTANQEWCRGNFNADTVTDGSDFGLWNSNKFTSADGINAVPEPTSIASLIGIAVGILAFHPKRANGPGFRRRRHHP
jgi:hypothetical protein